MKPIGDLTREKLMREYVVLKKSCAQIAEETSPPCCTDTVRQRLAKYGIPRRDLGEASDVAFRAGRKGKLLPIPSPPLSEAMAYVLGVVGPGDGHVGRYKTMLLVADQDFAAAFAQMLKKAFGMAPSRAVYPPPDSHRQRRHAVWLCSVRVYEYFLGFGVSFKEKSWRVPQKIKSAGSRIIASYVRAFADSQGNVVDDKKKGTKAIRLASKNYYGLLEIKDLLSKLGIPSKIYTSPGRASIIYISGHLFLKRFADVVGFSILRKRRKLLRALKSYVRLTKSDVDPLVSKMVELKGAGWSNKEISQKLGVPESTVWLRLSKLY